MADLRFDRFYRYDELTSALTDLAAERPDLMAIEAIGTSFEGRSIWLATLTNRTTGPHHEKPALWLDANIHSVEVTGSTAALHLIWRLVSGHGSDETVTRALDTRCFYVVPRINPDGVEWALADSPRFVRSSVRPYPRPDRQDGLHPEDIDGDGRILTMRVPDRNGTWKSHPDEPRLLIPRDPDEPPGDGLFRLLVEGLVENYDGVTIPVPPRREGLDLNRNFPMEWRTEGEEAGSGPYPASEPEISALVKAIVERPNICSFITYHTQSGVHLRPYSTHPDEHMPTEDLKVYKLIGARATALTGYPAVSVYHDFRYDPKDITTGASDDWMYDHRGVFAWTTEFWSPLRAAGIKDFHFIDWYDDHPVEDDLALIRWSDTECGGLAYVDWYPFEHPQLGPVELGGWHSFRYWANPPPDRMESEIVPHSEFALFHLLISPRLELRSLAATPLGAGTWKVRLVVENSGWLATSVSRKATDRKVVRPVEAEIGLPAGATLATGRRRVELGQLEGRAMRRNMPRSASDGTPDRVKVDWVVVGEPGTEVTVEARHDRAGVVRAAVTLA